MIPVGNNLVKINSECQQKLELKQVGMQVSSQTFKADPVKVIIFFVMDLKQQPKSFG